MTQTEDVIRVLIFNLLYWEYIKCVSHCPVQTTRAQLFITLILLFSKEHCVSI